MQPGNKMDIKKFLADNSLSIVLSALFLIFLCGQFYFGYLAYNDNQSLYRLPPVGYGQYARTGNFLNGVFVNWQAAILQLGSLVVFSIFLVQRGATHSKEPGREGNREKVGPYGGMRHLFRDNSLSIVLLVLFLLSFFLHLASGRIAVNQARELVHAAPISTVQFFASPKFWFLTFQTWQAEYMAIALYIVLSVFLRQDGSPESKPPDAANSVTGEANK
jgi:hypothetical protein